jgi:GNAT superfamily N-acetyltransferase
LKPTPAARDIAWKHGGDSFRTLRRFLAKRQNQETSMQGTRPTLRIARMSDRADLEALMRRSVQTLCIRDYSARQIADVGRDFGFGNLDEELILDGTYFVAEMQGAIVGCGGWSRRMKLLEVRDDDTGLESALPHPAAGKAAIRAIFVDPAMSGHGIGRLLVRAAESSARSHGFQTFELAATLTGVPLYRKLDYRTKGLFSFGLSGGGRFAIVLMGKDGKESDAREPIRPEAGVAAPWHRAKKSPSCTCRLGLKDGLLAR